VLVVALFARRRDKESLRWNGRCLPNCRQAAF
jgi:hypothetical protein